MKLGLDTLITIKHLGRRTDYGVQGIPCLSEEREKEIAIRPLIILKGCTYIIESTNLNIYISIYIIRA